MRIAYFINQYPAVSHTFIRREICALEAGGSTIIRYALESSPNAFPDLQDEIERKKTRYILGAGIQVFFGCLCRTILTQPKAFLRALRLAVQIGWRSDRGLLRHFAYILEALVLAEWSRQEAVEHIHAHFGTNSTTVAMLAAAVAGVPYSFTAHGPDEFERAALMALNLKLRHAEFAVCVSHFGRSQLMRWTSPDQWHKIALVHCGLDESFLREDCTSVPSRARLLCIGRLEKQKAHLTLVAAAHLLRNAGVGFELIIIGDGAMRSQIENAIREAGLSHHIFLAGWASGDRVRAELTAARALILPSFAENLPVVIMEAMACARPVIATYVAGIPELVVPGETGWLVPASDEVALAEAMHRVLKEPSDKLTDMGLKGRARVMEQHAVRNEAAKLRLLFERRRVQTAHHTSASRA